MTAMLECPITGDISPVIVGVDFKEFDCPTCGRFRISGTVQVTHAGKHDELARALKNAQMRVNPDQVPMISNLPS